MSMVALFVAIPAAHLDSYLADPESIPGFLFEEENAADEPRVDLGKTWHAIHFLLNGEA